MLHTTHGKCSEIRAITCRSFPPTMALPLSISLIEENRCNKPVYWLKYCRCFSFYFYMSTFYPPKKTGWGTPPTNDTLHRDNCLIVRINNVLEDISCLSVRHFVCEAEPNELVSTSDVSKLFHKQHRIIRNDYHFPKIIPNVIAK